MCSISALFFKRALMSTLALTSVKNVVSERNYGEKIMYQPVKQDEWAWRNFRYINCILNDSVLQAVVQALIKTKC